MSNFNDLKVKNETSLLMCAISIDFEKNVALFIQIDCKVVDIVDDEFTTLHQIVKFDFLRIVRILLDNDFDVHAMTIDDSIILHYVLSKIKKEINVMMKLLIMRDVDLCKVRKNDVFLIDLLIENFIDDQFYFYEYLEQKRMTILHTLISLMTNVIHESLLSFNKICQLQFSISSK